MKDPKSVSVIPVKRLESKPNSILSAMYDIVIQFSKLIYFDQLSYHITSFYHDSSVSEEGQKAHPN